MPIAMIAAMASNRTIGTDNKLPWKLPADMAYFVAMTTGKTVIMGRKTFESFGSRPLKNRHNVILTHDRNYTAPGCEIVHSVQEVLQRHSQADEQLMVIGGEQVYREFLPLADIIYLTEIRIEASGDASFPELDSQEWELAESVPGVRNEANDYDYCFQTYRRIPSR